MNNHQTKGLVSSTNLLLTTFNNSSHTSKDHYTLLRLFTYTCFIIKSDRVEFRKIGKHRLFTVIKCTSSEHNSFQTRKICGLQSHHEFDILLRMREEALKKDLFPISRNSKAGRSVIVKRLQS